MEKETKPVKKKKGPAPVLTEQQIKFATLLVYEAGRKALRSVPLKQDTKPDPDNQHQN